MGAWSSGEDETLRVYFPRHGMKWPGWAEVLPGRSWDSIRARASRMGIGGDGGRAITIDEKLRRLMESGIAMSQIDLLMGWPPDHTKNLLMRSWEKV